MLQRYDGVVQSVLQVRGIFRDMTNEEFAAWYEDHFKITEKRVLGILAADKREVGAHDSVRLLPM